MIAIPVPRDSSILRLALVLAIESVLFWQMKLAANDDVQVGA